MLGPGYIKYRTNMRYFHPLFDELTGWGNKNYLSGGMGTFQKKITKFNLFCGHHNSKSDDNGPVPL